MGLALVRRIVKLSGGRLGVKSKQGRGSQFWVELRKFYGYPVISFTERDIALVIGEKTLVDAAVKPEFKGTSDGSDYSGGLTMEKALDLENEKFAKPEGEGETPSTIQEEPFGSKQPIAQALNPQADSALKTIMEQRGLFELSSRRPSPAASDASTIASLANSALRHQLTQVSPANPMTRDSTLPSLEPRHMEFFADAPTEKPLGPATFVDPSVPIPKIPTQVPSPPSGQNLAEIASPALGGIPEHAVSPQPEKGLRVLVVDDDTLTRTLMARMLTRLGCIVETAENGKIALEKILGRKFDFPPDSVRPPGSTAPPSPTTPGEQYFDIVFLDNQMVSRTYYRINVGLSSCYCSL